MHKIGDIVADREGFWVKADQSVKEVVDFMCERQIGAVAVKRGNEVVGVFSGRDLMRRVVHKGLDPETTPVSAVMSPGCMKVPPDEDYRIAKMHMYDRQVGHLVVMDENDELLGLVALRDLIEVDVQEYADLVAKLNDRYYQRTWQKEDES